MVGWAPLKESSDRRGYSTDEESGKKPNLKGYVAKAICTPIQRNNLTYLASNNSKFDSMKNNHFVLEVNMTLVTSFMLSVLQCTVELKNGRCQVSRVSTTNECGGRVKWDTILSFQSFAVDTISVNKWESKTIIVQRWRSTRSKKKLNSYRLCTFPNDIVQWLAP